MSILSTIITNQSLAISTIEQYEGLYSGFEKRIRKQESMAENDIVHPAKLAMFFNDNEGGWKSKTARLYRAALMHGFRKKTDDENGQYKGAIELLTHIHDGEEDRLSRMDDLRQKRKELAKMAPRGPSQKVKRFSKKDAEILVKELIAMRSPNGSMAATWFIATILTGLRPCEWSTALIKSHHTMQFALVVQNAKATNGRAHGVNRSLVLSEMNDAQNKIIREHLSNVTRENENGKLNDFYRNCRRCMERTADAIWPNRQKHPSIYTARHMFAADIKSVFNKYEVAALMGHASIETAGSHYARRWSGSGSVGVSPDEFDVSAVMALNQKPANENAWMVNAIPKEKTANKKMGGNQGL